MDDDNMMTCRCCGIELPEDEMTPGEEDICLDCYTQQVACDRCGWEYPEHELTEHKGSLLCYDCLEIVENGEEVWWCEHQEIQEIKSSEGE